MDKFLEKYNLLKLLQEQIENNSKKKKIKENSCLKLSHMENGGKG